MGQRLNPFGVLQVVHLVRQDLSIAGKRAGLAGARSGLFMEQVRIVKEMRAEDKRNGRTGNMVRPRYLVWENVPGAFSSNRGKDFAAVLEEIIKIVEPEAPGIEVPEKGWPTWGGYHDEMGGRWSVVWRTHDAQYWGVPQRRRRISVVADFGGDTASEIQFDPKSLPGDIAESGAAGEEPAEATERGFNPAVGDCMTAWDCQSKRIFDTNGKSPTLQGSVGGGVNNPAIFCMATQQGGAELRTDDRAPTLTAAAGMSGNNQPVVAIPINDKATRWQGGGESRNHDGSGNGLGIGKEGDPSPTLTAGDRHGVMCMTPWDAQSQRVYDGDGVSPTLSSRENSGLNREAVLCAGFKLGNSEKAHSIGYEEETSPTLNAECGGNKPAVVSLDMTHACDVIRECGEQAPSLQARMGTGGNQVPLTYQMNGFGDYRAAEVASSCKQRDFKDSTDLVCAVDCRNFREGGEVNGTLQAKESGGQSLNLNNTVRQNMVVRRLTPMECERLQGFPDGWTDIGDWVKTDKRGREIKVKGSADSPRYKALGNSIALPFWDWMLRRMARYLPEDATLGSLFDGIGGFPLCFERIHGRGTARWASEIEPFPIAVTKKWFGEE
nr:MAG TPA: Cytosine specific methyltransferase [Caudoviricetes sp.]